MKQCPKCKTAHSKPGTFCSRNCANSRVFSNEAIEKKSLANKKWAENNPTIAKENMNRALSAWVSKKTYVDRYCSSCEKTLDRTNKSGLCKKHFEDSEGKSEYIARRKNYERRQVFNKWSNTYVWLLSSLEIKYFEYLENNNIEWSKPNYISYTTADNKQHRYFPDFFLIESNKFIEVKGYYWPTDKVKMKLVAEQNPTLEIEILFKEDIDTLGVTVV
jgi:hypothetical protein